EDLVASPRAQMARVCDFLGVEYSERMFDYIMDTSYKAPDANLSFQWKRMRKLDLQRVESKLGDTLLSRGYRLSSHPRIAVSDPLERYLYLHSRFGVFIFRLRRYGIRLTLLETFSRRLGLRRAHQYAIGRIDRITDSTLE